MLSKVVLEIGSLNIEGTVIPDEWFPYFKKPDNSVNLIEMLILAEIVRVYKPVKVVCDSGGTKLQNKFKGPAYVIHFYEWGQRYGVEGVFISEIIQSLRDKGMINVKEINLGSCYIRPVVAKLREMSWGDFEQHVTKKHDMSKIL